MNFILFGNLTYGEVAIQKFAELSKTYPDHNFRIVLSGKEFSYSDKNKLMFVSDLNSTVDLGKYRNDLSNRLAFPVEIETDVNRKHFVNTLAEDTIGFCLGFNQMFSASLFDRVLLVVNFHPSLLPFYRSPLPVYWCLKRGEQLTGYTAHVMTKKIEQVNIIYQDVVEVDPLMSVDELETRIGQKAADYAEDMIQRFLTGRNMRYRTLDAHSIYKYPASYFSLPDLNKVSNGRN